MEPRFKTTPYVRNIFFWVALGSYNHPLGNYPQKYLFGSFASLWASAVWASVKEELLLSDATKRQVVNLSTARQ